MSDEYFVRKCQECNHLQQAKEPKEEMSDAYRHSKCRKCKSMSLDYGSYGWKKNVNGDFVHIEFSEDTP